jgi:hypothetical protein
LKLGLCTFEHPSGGEYLGKTACQAGIPRFQKFINENIALIISFEDHLVKFVALYKVRRCGKICGTKLIGFCGGIETLDN